MKLNHLSFSNFKGFKKLNLDLTKGNLSVFIGKNGAGKSTIVEAINILWTDIISEQGIDENVIPIPLGYGLSKDDIHNNESEAKISATFDDIEISVTRTQETKSFPKAEMTKLTRYLKEREDKLPVPIFLSFTHERVFNLENTNEDDDSNFKNPIYEVWKNPFNCEKGHGLDFLTWFSTEENIENQERLSTNEKYRSTNLTFFREALKKFLSGMDATQISDLIIYRDPKSSNARAREGELFIMKGNHKYKFSMLSGGEKAIIFMVAEIARRLILANKTKPLEGNGLVVIDEIEMHLHPSWQKNILPSLSKTFPNLQFIITTHSPLVISSIKNANIFSISNFKIDDFKNKSIYGHDSNFILENIMSTDSRPSEINALLDEIRTDIDKENYSAAEKKINELEKTLGPNDSELIALRTLLVFVSDEEN